MNALMVIFATTALATYPVSPLSAQPELLGTPPASNEIDRPPQPVITQACRRQTKPPCLIETRYLHEPDGSNVTKIMLAYPVPEPKTNAQSLPYYTMTTPPCREAAILQPLRAIRRCRLACSWFCLRRKDSRAGTPDLRGETGTGYCEAAFASHDFPCHKHH